MITRNRIPAAAQVMLALFAVYVVGRGIAEPFVIDVNDPSTYRLDWGGPSLLGVLAVHCGPAVLVLGTLARRLHRTRAAK